MRRPPLRAVSRPAAEANWGCQADYTIAGRICQEVDGRLGRVRPSLPSKLTHVKSEYHATDLTDCRELKASTRTIGVMVARTTWSRALNPPRTRTRSTL